MFNLVLVMTIHHLSWLFPRYQNVKPSNFNNISQVALLHPARGGPWQLTSLGAFKPQTPRQLQDVHRHPCRPHHHRDGSHHRPAGRYKNQHPLRDQDHQHLLSGHQAQVTQGRDRHLQEKLHQHPTQDVRQGLQLHRGQTNPFFSPTSLNTNVSMFHSRRHPTNQLPRKIKTSLAAPCTTNTRAPGFSLKASLEVRLLLSST